MRYNSGIKIWMPVLVLVLCGMAVLLERFGVVCATVEKEPDGAGPVYSEALPQDTVCLILTSQEEPETSAVYEKMMVAVLDGMKVGYDIRDAEAGVSADLLEKYETVIVTFQEWGCLGENLPELFSWVKKGGGLMAAVTPAWDSCFQAIALKAGIISCDGEYPEVRGFRMRGDCMIGAAPERLFSYVEEGEEGLHTSLMVELDESCRVWMESQEEVPLIWTRDYGAGTVAIVNEALTEKYQRGFLAMTYSMLYDLFLYPVIDASAFYLDDFPAPVPEGNAAYIERDYGVDVAAFYAGVWWPKILEWESEYGIYHTGLIIEQYSDRVMGPFAKTEETGSFLKYGNMLLNRGGELGYHGYNHMPLCVKGKDEGRQFGAYALWPSEKEMENSLRELQRFSEELFPEAAFGVYVPPSNILSESGKEALLRACPGIGIIAGTYLRDADGRVYEQEFGVDADGIIHTPRIVSGCNIEAYQIICALSELNFQYVQSHFMHPDDVLDEERGADLGWEALSGKFETYLDWIYGAAPTIRNVTGSGMGRAVEQYAQVSLKRERTAEGCTVKLGGFSGEASFLLRIRDKGVVRIEGGSLEQLTGQLYVIHAKEKEIRINLDGKGAVGADK